MKGILEKLSYCVNFCINLSIEAWFCYKICLICENRLRYCTRTRHQRRICKRYNKTTECKYYFDVELTEVIKIVDNNMVIDVSFLTSFSESIYDSQINNGVKHPLMCCNH